MKIIYSVCHRIEVILSLHETMEQVGVDNIPYYIENYNVTHSYIKKKLNKYGILKDEKKYWKDLEHDFVKIVKREKPDMVLFIDIILSSETLTSLRKICPLTFWFVDPVMNRPEIARLSPQDKIFVYEHDSENFIRKMGIEALYLPVGYNMSYKPLTKEKNIDVVFVGSPYKKRCKILNRVAEAADKNGWNFQTYGLYFESPYFWKPVIFKNKYKALYRHIKLNGELKPAEVCKIYNSAKIVLNIHDDSNSGVNPRTFDIMATNSMEILDTRRDYDILHPGVDMVTFDDVDDLISKVEYYLKHTTEREKIAQSGYNNVVGKRSMCDCIEYALKMNVSK